MHRSVGELKINHSNKTDHYINKKFYFFIGLILIFFASQIFARPSTDEAPWVYTGLSGKAYSLTYDRIAIYASIDGGIYKSTNGGQNWEFVGNGLPGGGGTSVLTYDAYAIYAGINNHGIYKSTNGGKTWQLINNGLPGSPQIKSLYWDGTDSIYTSITNEGIFKSKDMGQTWQKANNGIPSTAFSLPFGPFAHDSQSGIYYGCSQGIYNSKNKGESWEKVSTGLPNPPLLITALGHDGNTLYTARFIPDYPVSSGETFKSSDKAKTWQKMNGIPFWDKEYGNFSMLVSFWGNNSVVYAATQLFGVYKSTNKGAAWVQTNEGFPHQRHFGAYAFVNDGSYLYVATDNGIFKKPLPVMLPNTH